MTMASSRADSGRGLLTDDLFRLRAGSVLGGLGQSLGGSAGALLANDLTHDETRAGLPQTMLVLGSAVAALGLSTITAHRGRLTALALGYFAAATGCVAAAAAAALSRLALLLAGSALLGAGNTAVMLSRYAAADLAPETARARAMASVLLATTIGAVIGPNLLAPSGTVASALSLPTLSGPYVVTALIFVAAGTAMSRDAGRARDTITSPMPVVRRLDRDGIGGLAVLATANLVMVAIMTMTPVHLHHLGMSLAGIGLVVSLHIAAMFAPSTVSGRLTDRIGPRSSASVAAGVTLVAGVLAAASSRSPATLVLALVLLGAGWNLSLIAGSALLTRGTAPSERVRREGWGEVSMGVAAAGGGVASGPVMATGGYSELALVGAVVATLAIPLAQTMNHGRDGRHAVSDLGA